MGSDEAAPPLRYSDLLCYVEGEPSPETTETVARELPALIAARPWVVEPPDFVDETYEGDHTVGVVLRLLPPLGTAGANHDLEAERATFADVEALVAWAERLSARDGVDFGFELDGNPVGWIEAGRAGKQLTQGLIEPWRARL